MLSMEIDTLTEQNALLQRQRAYLSNLVQEKDKQIMELQQQLGLFTGVPTPAIPQPTVYLDSSQIHLQQQEQDEDQRQHLRQAKQQEQPAIHHHKDGGTGSYPRSFSKFGIGIQWAQSIP